MSDNQLAHKEAFWLLADRLVGSGIDRQVYTSRLLPDCVIKVEEGSRSFQNVIEWETWQWVKDTAFKRWFAPCRFISPCGLVLVMERTTEPAIRQYPDKMPVFLTDFKRPNYGMLNGRLVCHDYGLHHLMDHGLSKRMRKANWWGA